MKIKFEVHYLSFTLFFIVTIASSVNAGMCHREFQERTDWTNIEILIRFGVSVNATDENKRTALHHACNDGKSRVIELLLSEHSIKLNEQDENGHTPLMLAAINGRFKAARIIATRLVKFDLDIDVRDNNGYTALLHAIKNQNYGIAYDLISYANACSTIRDNENFMNATEWLDQVSIDRNKLNRLQQTRRGTLKASVRSEKPELSEDDENDQEKSSRIASASIPLVTVSASLPVAHPNDIPIAEYSLARMVAESPSKPNLLFDQLPYQHYMRSRPSSSVLSKSSLISSKIQPKKVAVPEYDPKIHESRTKQSTIADEGSIYSYNVSQGSKLGDDLLSTPGRSLLSSTEENKSKFFGNNFKNVKEKRQSVRNPVASAFQVDLGQINAPPSEYSVVHTDLENIFSSVNIKDMPDLDITKSNPVAAETLKSILKKEKKTKISRTSTALSLKRPEEDVGRLTKSSLSMQGMETDRTLESTYKKKRSPPSNKKLPKHMSMRRFLSRSTLSDDFYKNNHLDPIAIEKAKKNMQVIFSLYTDSLLWAPPRKPTDSLVVQTVGNESEKMTLTSEHTTSVSDSASLAELTSAITSEDGNTKTHQQEVKVPSARSRLVSATSRSKKSARINSSRASSAIHR